MYANLSELPDALFCVGTADHLLDDTLSWRIDGKQLAMTVSLLSTPEYPTLSLCFLRISWSYFLLSVIAGLREFSLDKLTRRGRTSEKLLHCLEQGKLPPNNHCG